jgi:hypothetical protein
MADPSNDTPAPILQQALAALDVAEAHLKMLLGKGAAAYPSLTFGQTIAAAQERLRSEVAKPVELEHLRARYDWLCAHLTQIHVETTQPAGSPADSPMRVTLIQAWPGLPRTDAASVDAAVVEAMKEGA